MLDFLKKDAKQDDKVTVTYINSGNYKTKQLQASGANKYIKYYHTNRTYSIFADDGYQVISNIDAPAIVLSNGAEYWIQDGKLHREGAPAVTYSDGTHEYWILGTRCYSEYDIFRAKVDLYPEGSTVMRTVNDTNYYFKLVKNAGSNVALLHREDGPASEDNQTKESIYYLNDRRLEYNNYITGLGKIKGPGAKFYIKDPIDTNRDNHYAVSETGHTYFTHFCIHIDVPVLEPEPKSGIADKRHTIYYIEDGQQKFYVAENYSDYKKVVQWKNGTATIRPPGHTIDYPVYAKDGPAIIKAKKHYWFDNTGALHRLDGPAIEGEKAGGFYYFHGRRYNSHQAIVNLHRDANTGKIAHEKLIELFPNGISLDVWTEHVTEKYSIVNPSDIDVQVSKDCANFNVSIEIENVDGPRSEARKIHPDAHQIGDSFKTTDGDTTIYNKVFGVSGYLKEPLSFKHREDGPAVENNETKRGSYFLKGEELTYVEYVMELGRIKDPGTKFSLFDPAHTDIINHYEVDEKGTRWIGTETKSAPAPEVQKYNYDPMGLYAKFMATFPFATTTFITDDSVGPITIADNRPLRHLEIIGSEELAKLRQELVELKFENVGLKEKTQALEGAPVKYDDLYGQAIVYYASRTIDPKFKKYRSEIIAIASTMRFDSGSTLTPSRGSDTTIRSMISYTDPDAVRQPAKDTVIADTDSSSWGTVIAALAAAGIMGIVGKSSIGNKDTNKSANEVGPVKESKPQEISK